MTDIHACTDCGNEYLSENDWLLLFYLGAVTPKDATQQNCFVESRRRRCHTESRDSTQPNYFVESRRTNGHIERRDTTGLILILHH